LRAYSDNGEFFALSTAGVIDERDPAEIEEAAEGFEHPDQGGVVQVFDINKDEMFTDDSDRADGNEFDPIKFVRT
jgi:hypothetical protein